METGVLTQTGILKKLLEIQLELKAPKNKFNSFGKYSYRTKEDILEVAKPLAHARGCTIVCNDCIQELACGWVYCASSAYLIDAESGEYIQASGNAREQTEKKGMDASQISGMAASYAGKRALGNLFSLDDTQDADAMDANQKSTSAQGGQKHTSSQSAKASSGIVAQCKACHASYTFTSTDHLHSFSTCPACNAPADFQVI